VDVGLVNAGVVRLHRGTADRAGRIVKSGRLSHDLGHAYTDIVQDRLSHADYH